jgi:hypothetical protein
MDGLVPGELPLRLKHSFAICFVASTRASILLAVRRGDCGREGRSSHKTRSNRRSPAWRNQYCTVERGTPHRSAVARCDNPWRTAENISRRWAERTVFQSFSTAPVFCSTLPLVPTWRCVGGNLQSAYGFLPVAPSTSQT